MHDDPLSLHAGSSSPDPLRDNGRIPLGEGRILADLLDILQVLGHIDSVEDPAHFAHVPDIRLGDQSRFVAGAFKSRLRLAGWIGEPLTRIDTNSGRWFGLRRLKAFKPSGLFASVDLLDLKIIRTMGIRPYGQRPQNPDVLRPSFLAKRLHVEPETVKAHLARMEAAGFIRFYQAYPNFRHLGIASTAYLFRVPDDDQKAASLERLQPIDGLVEIHNFLGAEMCVEVTYRAEHDLTKKLRLLAEFTGDSEPTRFYDRDLPPVPQPLTRLDWRIVKALRYRGRRPLAEVADEVGVSPRTARRRYDRLMKEGSMFIAPTVDPSKAPGTILFELLFYTTAEADESTVQRVLQTYDDRYLYHYVPASPTLGNFDVLLATDSTGDIEALRQRGRLIPGIEKVSALVFRGWSEYTDWIDAAIEERLKSS